MDFLFVFDLFKAIAGPLLILLAVFFLAPPLLTRLRKVCLSGDKRARFDFQKELNSVFNRANDQLPAPLAQSPENEITGAPKEALLASWTALEATMKELGFKHYQVNRHLDPYPLDYVLFELEMKKRARNSVIGIFRDLSRLKDAATCREEMVIDNASAQKYVRLACRVVEELQKEPNSSGFSLF